MTRPLRREDGRLDPSKSAVELERQVRAYQPWPGSYLETPVGRLIVWSASVEAAESGDNPGLIVAVGRDGLALGTPLGRLVLGNVQIAGKKPSTAVDLRRGYPAIVGAAVVLDTAHPRR
jgi:methionyl-tRNA formyltransferase